MSTSPVCCAAAIASPTTGTTGRRCAGSRSAGIDLVRGHAEFTGVKRVRVTAEDGTVTDLVARHAVAVATGSASLLPDIPGLREIDPWTSRDATSAQEIPASLAVIGGGVVAAEMATAYAGFGTKVTLLVRTELLENMEPFAAELVEASLEKTRSHGAQGRRGHRGAPHREERRARALGRRPGRRRAGARRDRAHAAHDRPRPRQHRLPARRVARGRRHAPGEGHRLALRGRRRQPSRAPDAPGQVPGARRRRRDRRPREAAARRRCAVGRARRDRRPRARPAGDLHRPRDRVGRTHRGRRPRGGAQHPRSRLRPVVARRGDHVRRPLRGDGARDRRRGPRRADRRDLRRARTSPSCCTRRPWRSSARCRSSRLWHAVPSYPTVSEVWLRWLEEYGRPTP